MKKLILFLSIVMYTGCMSNYPRTTFYVKNTSDKTINFTASVMKYSSMGRFEMTLPFMVLPHDSVLARIVGYRKDALPIYWYTKFIIFPVEGIIMNDPNNAENWIKSTDEKGKTIYTFSLTK